MNATSEQPALARRWACIALLAPFAAALLLLAARGFPDFLTGGDLALLEQSTLEATRGAQALGPYSRLGFNHPGPAFFYAAAPLYAATGHAASAPFATALAINLLSSALMLRAARTLGPSRRLVLSALLALFFLLLGGRLATTWNPYVSIPPFLCSVVLLAAVANGELRWLPAAVLTASFSVQCHFGYLPATAALFVAALALAGLNRETPARPLGTRWGVPILASAAVFAAMWWLPLRAEWAEGPGNLARIAAFFRSPQPHPPAAELARAVARIFGDFLSAPARLAGPWRDRVPDGVLIALAQIVLFLRSYVRCLRSDDRAGARFGSLTLVLALAMGWSALRITGPIYENLITWMTSAGLFMTFHILRDVGQQPLRLARPLCGIALGLWATAGSAMLLRSVNQTIAWETNTAEGRAASEVIGGTLAALEPASPAPILVRQLDDGVWRIRAALTLALGKRGAPFRVDPHWFYEYTAARLATEPPPRYLFLASPDVASVAQPGPGLRVLASDMLCVALYRDVAESLKQPRLAVTHAATAWAVWPLAAPATAGKDCTARVAGGGVTYMTELQPGRRYRLALALRPLMPGVQGIDCAMNGVPLGSAAFAAGGTDYQRFEFDVPATCPQPMNTLWIAVRGAATGEARATLAVKSVEFSAE